MEKESTGSVPNVRADGRWRQPARRIAHKKEKIPFPERFELLTQGDPKQVSYFLGLLAVSEEVLASATTIDSFFNLITMLLVTGDAVQSFGALYSIYQFTKMTNVKFDAFLNPDVLSKVCANLTSEEVTVIHLSLRLLTNLLSSCPQILMPLCELGFLDNLWNVMLHPDSSPELENDRIFQRSANDVCEAVDTILSIPECTSCLEALWVTSIRLLHVDYGAAMRGAITFMAQILEMGVPKPTFDDETLARLAELGSEGEITLRPFFGFLCCLNDGGETWKVLCSKGLLANLMYHIENFSDDSFIIYRFFGDIRLDPSTIPKFFEHTLEFFMNHGTFRIRKDIIGYLSAVFGQLSPDSVAMLIDHGFLSIVIECATSARDRHTLKSCLDLISSLIDTQIARGVNCAQCQEFVGLTDELTRALEVFSESEKYQDAFASVESILSRLS